MTEKHVIMVTSTLPARPHLLAFAVLSSLAWASRPSAANDIPDVEVVSVGASHTDVAPGSSVLLTVVVRARGASTGPVEVRAYYADGVPPSGVPGDARELGVHALTRGIAKDQVVTFGMPIRMPPCDACGKRTVFVQVEPGSRSLNLNKRNDVRAVTLDVAHEHVPELRVTGVSIDRDRGSIADTVRVRGTVRNDSPYYAEGPFRVAIYCSADQLLTRNDRRLHSFMVSSLAARQVVGVDRTVTLDPGCGVYGASTWIGIVADDQATLRDANPDNNGASLPYWVLRAPDLTSGAFTVSANQGPAGSRVLVSYRVGNQGDAGAVSFKTGVYLAKPGEALDRGELLDGATVPSVAASSRSGLMQHVVTIPRVPRGQYVLGVRVDVDGENGELRRRNNAMSERFDVTEINLREAHFRAATRNVSASSEVRLSFAVRNEGKDAAPASKVAFYYSDDPRFDRQEDPRLTEAPIGKLRPGRSSAEQTVTVTVPPRAREGYHFLLAVLDDEDVVSETDERDNVALEPVYVLPSELAIRD